MAKVILHADLNNFYASVACLHRPDLREVPVAVCGDPARRHGIVLAKNMPAKRYGIQTGQVLWQAFQLCPRLTTIAPDYREVSRMSQTVRTIFGRYTDRVQPFGIDEAWLDLTAPDMTLEQGERIANHLRHTVREETGLTVSVGVSDSRVLAKLGSDLKKPDAVSLICEQNRSQVLDPLPIGSLLFVGRATARKLNAIGIYTVGQLAAADPQVLRGVLGKAGLTLSGFARGADDASLFLDDQPVKSVGNSTTTPSDVTDERGARLTLLDLSESVAFRLRQQGMAGRVVELSLRDTAMRTVTRQLTLDRPTDCSYNILDGAMDLLDRHWRPRVPLRVWSADGKLIGINTLITSYSGNYSGVGFAIPVNYAVNIAQQIIEGKTPTHAQLGVSLSTVNSQNAKRYGLKVDSGAYISAVNSGSGAAEAGLEEGDIVTKFDGKDVASASDLMLDVRSKNPGDKVTLDVNRNGETKQVEVTLGSDESSQSASTQQNSAQESLLERLLGGGSGSSENAA